MHQYKNNPENGSTLVVTVLVLVILSILGTAALTMTNTELLIARNMKLNAKAFYNGETGISIATEQIRASIYDEGTSYPLTIDNYEIDVNATSDSGYLDQDGGKVIIYNNETDKHLICEVDVKVDNDSYYKKYALISDGYYKDAAKSIKVEIEDLSNLIGDVPGAISIFNPESSLNLSGNMYVSSEVNDIVPIYLDDTNSDYDKEGSAEIEPQPPEDDYPKGYSEQTNEYWTELAIQLEKVAHEDNIYLKDGDDKVEFSGDPEIIVVEGSRNITGGTGAGILITKGQVKITGNFWFTGLIISIVEPGEDGEAQVDFEVDTTGTPTINGAYLFAGESSNITINGNPEIIYDADALEDNANIAAKRAVLIKNYWKLL
jgi:hypothetical protein